MTVPPLRISPGVTTVKGGTRVQDIRVQGDFDVHHLHSVLLPAADDSVAVIDLDHARFVTPAGLLSTITFAQRAARQGRKIQLARPRSDEVANYVARAHLGSAIDELGGQHDLPTVREHDVGMNLLAIKSFDNDLGADGLAHHVWHIVHDLDEDAAAVIYMALAGIGENVGRHSGQSRGYVAAQKTHRGRVLRFAVGDAGRGFRKSLAHHEPKTDADALRLALQPGVTGSADGTGGYGLSELREKFREIGGTLHLRSGRGSRTEYSRGPAVESESQTKLHGSILEGEIRIRRAS